MDWKLVGVLVFIVIYFRKQIGIFLFQWIMWLNAPFTEDTILLIGVDATPNRYGGYCVNFQEKTLQYYMIRVEDFPWPPKNKDDPNEFEMKNLQFALATWSEDIKEHKRFKIYTDNFSARKWNGRFDSKFGEDAQKLLGHFKICLGARLVDEKICINWKSDLWGLYSKSLWNFAKYIQPADDLSRWEIEKGVKFLCDIYGIKEENVEGNWTLRRSRTHRSKPYYDKNYSYNETVEKATQFASGLDGRCRNCRINTISRYCN